MLIYNRFDEERYPSASQRCPKCRKSFRVLEDEQGMHPCPRCGYWIGDDRTSDQEEDMWEDE